MFGIYFVCATTLTGSITNWRAIRIQFHLTGAPTGAITNWRTGARKRAIKRARAECLSEALISVLSDFYTPVVRWGGVSGTSAGTGGN